MYRLGAAVVAPFPCTKHDKLKGKKMNLNDLTIGEAKKLAAMFGGGYPVMQSDMIGKYVIVRCRDAGVHAGTLEATNGRECSLSDSRRLWYWKPANKASFLSGVATEGLHENSKIGAPIDINLTESCEIILCSAKAMLSIEGMKSHEQ